jgi:hypothetical protein
VTGDRAILVALDAKSYSGTVASEHGPIQQDLRHVLAGAAEDARLPRERWIEQAQGDGMLVLAPPDFEPRYVDDFIAHLQAHLRRRNRDRVPDGRLRVRIGLDQGPAGVGANGFTGEAPIRACRLRDAELTKRALADSAADLVLAMSNGMFLDNVGLDRTRTVADEYTHVRIDEEKFHDVAWLWLPHGHTSQSLAEARTRSALAVPAPGVSAGRDVITASGSGNTITTHA